GSETLAERAQTIGQLPVVAALDDMLVPASEPDCRNPDALVAADQQPEPGGVAGKAGRRRRTIVGNLPLLAQCADQFRARRPALAIRSGEVVIAGIEPIERAGDFRLIDRQRPGAVGAERQGGDGRLPGQDARYGRAYADRVGRAARA